MNWAAIQATSAGNVVAPSDIVKWQVLNASNVDYRLSETGGSVTNEHIMITVNNW